MNRRKEKLEASLDSLFSGAKRPASRETPSEAPVTVTAESKTPQPTPVEKTVATTPAAVSPASQIEAVDTDDAIPSSSSTAPQTVSTTIAQSVASVPLSGPGKSAIEPIQEKANAPKNVSNDVIKQAEAIKEETSQIITFLLNKDYYGIDISAIQTIIKPQAPCPVPFTPAYVEGLINLRGQIVPVLDLRGRLGFPPLEIDADSRVIIVNIEDEWAGVRVDAVSGVLTLNSDLIEPAADFVAGTDARMLSGIAKNGKQLVLILDVKAVFELQGRYRRGSAVSTKLEQLL